MSRTKENILLLATGPLDESLAQAVQRYGDDAVSVLSCDLDGQDQPLPESWQVLCAGDLLDTDALRHDFLQFLDAWPRQTLLDGRSFDQMFRRPGGYSVWWTGPGAERHPDWGIFAKLKTLWLFDRAIKARAPQRVLIHTKNADLAWSLVSRCEREACPCEFLPGSAHATRSPWSRRRRWLGTSILRFLGWPIYVLIRAAFARLLARPHPDAKRKSDTPAIVFASEFFRYSQIDHGRITFSYWQELCDALAKANGFQRQCYLPKMTFGEKFQGHQTVLHLYHTGWRLLRNLPNAAPTKERFVACGAQLRAAAGHLASIARYYRLERTGAFRSSFVFAGADVSSIYVPQLRRAITRQGQWTQTVAAIVKSIQAVGKVKVMLVAEEMYEFGMFNIAAARELGIPTIGVQHGTIFPMHMIYTLPPGQLEGAPVPDYFAAYSEHAKETLSVHGSYPADRVWVTGGPRFDDLVKAPPDSSVARDRLGLPRDKRIVLIGSQNFPWFPRAARAVFEATREKEDCLVCLKAHPRDVSLDVYRRIAQQAGAENVRFFEDHFSELLAACDVLISGSSTTVFEAILLGRKTICVNFSGEPNRYPYAEDGGSVGAESVEQVRAALEYVFSEECQPEWEAKREAFLKRHAGPSAQGRAAEVLTQRIVEVMSGRPIDGNTA